MDYDGVRDGQAPGVGCVGLKSNPPMTGLHC